MINCINFKDCLYFEVLNAQLMLYVTKNLKLIFKLLDVLDFLGWIYLLIVVALDIYISKLQ